MFLMPRLISRSALSLALMLGAATCFADTLRISAIPDEAPTELQRKFKPLGEYLEKETGLKVQFTPVSDYAAVVEGLAAKKIDLAWLGGFTFVQAKLRTGGEATPIVQRAEDEVFTSKFIVPADSPVKSLADLKGKTFAFGSPSSTSGHLMPRFFLLKDGIDPDKDFRNVAFSGAHDATVAFRRLRQGRRRCAQRFGDGQADREGRCQRQTGQGDRHHAALLRLQLDRAPRPRRRRCAKKSPGLPQARPGQSGAAGTDGPAARLEVRADHGGQLRRHRSVRRAVPG
jgi:phosphate/phosphite/phosphonate ABC transporter binding protein